MNRDDALALVKEMNTQPGHVSHALAVEAAMRSYARRFGEDEEVWGLVGLLHDFDYEVYPDLHDHTIKGGEILREKGYPDHLITAIRSHNDATSVPRTERLHHALHACDELSGFITACALVRPSKSVMDLETKSVVKKMKDKAFARPVNREEMRQAAEELGVEFGEHVANVIEAMRRVAGELGL
jgi:putative nucleotidyltransferase with HDIG domain